MLLLTLTPLLNRSLKAFWSHTFSSFSMISIHSLTNGMLFFLQGAGSSSRC